MLNDRTIYRSLGFLPKGGLPVLADFGEARLGDQEHNEDIMPNVYRAPEVILRSSWNHKVDIWNIAMVVSETILVMTGLGKANMWKHRSGILLAPVPLSMAQTRMVYLMTGSIWQN